MGTESSKIPATYRVLGLSFGIVLTGLIAASWLLHQRALDDISRRLAAVEEKQKLSSEVEEGERSRRTAMPSQASTEARALDTEARPTPEVAKLLAKIEEANANLKQVTADSSAKINEFIAGNDPIAADYLMGTIRLAISPAENLRESMTLATGMESEDYLQRVGGIVFEQTATPQAGFAVSKLGIAYSPSAKDGSRLVVTINDKPLSADIPDWELVPIARFASTKETACVTFLGGLSKRKLQDDVKWHSGKIINYHPKLADSVLGVRLLQANILVLDRNAATLPSPHDAIGWGKPVYATGEKPIAPADGRTAFTELEMARLDQEELVRDFANVGTFLLCDFNTPVSFREERGKLQFSGEPVHYFFAGKNDGFAHLPRLDKFYAEHHHQIRGINPLVWDSSVQTMRYAAFFRYCRDKYPEEWKTFLGQLPAVPEQPRMRTPNILMGLK